MGKSRYLPSITTLRKIAAFASMLSLSVGIAGVIGWIFRLSFLTQFVTGTAHVTLNSSVCMALLGVSLWLRRDNIPRPTRVHFAQTLALFVSCIGFLSLLEILSGWDLHIDQLWMIPTAEGATGRVRPGLMSPVGAGGFLLLGLAVSSLDWTIRRNIWPAQALAILAELGSSYALLDFILSPQGHHVGISLQAAVVLCVFPLGVLATRPERGLGKLILDTASLWCSDSGKPRSAFQSAWVRYGLAIIAAVVGTIFHLWLLQFDVKAPFLTFTPLLLTVALLAGTGPGIFGVLLSAVSADYFRRVPYGFGRETVSDSIALDIFLLTGTGFCLMIGLLDLHRQRAQLQARQAESEIRKSEAKYRTLVENLTHKIAYKDRSSTYISCNQNYARDLNIQADEIAGKTDFDFFPRELAEKYRNDDQRVMQNGRAEQIEERSFQDGKAQWVNTVRTPVRDETGEVSGVLLIFWDITDRKQAESAALAERQRFKAMLDALPAMICLLTPDYEVTFANRAMRQHFGAPDEHKCHNYPFDDSTPREFCQADRALHFHTPQDWEIELPTGVVVHVYAVPFTDSDGSPLILEMNIDVTEQRRVEQALRQSENELKVAQRIAHVGSWRLDIASGRVQWTDELFRMYGMEPAASAPPYDTHRSLFTPTSWELLYPAVELLARTGQPYELELEIVRTDATQGWMQVRGEADRDSQGAITGLRGVALDITARKRAELALQSEQQLFWRLFESSPALCAVTDLLQGDKVLDVNTVFEQVTGFRREEVIGKTVPDLQLWPDAREYAEALQEIQSSGSLRKEMQFRHKSAQIGTLLVSVAAVEISGRKCALATGIDITDLKRAESELRESEERYRSVVTAMAEGVVLQSADGTILACNASGERILGMAKAELQSQSSMSLETVTIHEDGSPFPGESHPAMVTLRTGKSMSNVRMGIRKRDHTTAWVEINAEPLFRTGESQPYAVVTTFSDISDRKQAEAELKESEARFRTLAESVPQMVWMCHSDGLNFYFNQRWVDYTGMTLEQSYGSGWNRPFHPDDKQAAWDAWNHATAAGETYQIESRLRAADGTYRWFLMRGTPLCDPNGRISRWFGTCTDIEDMKRAEAELRFLNAQLENKVAARTAELLDSRERLEYALKSSEEGVWDRNLETGHVWFSPRCYEIVGYSQEELELHTDAWVRLIHPEDRKATLDMVDAVISGRGKYEAEFRVRHKDGHYVSILSRGVPIRHDPHGPIVRIVGTHLDLTSRKAAEEALRTSEEKYRTLFENIEEMVSVYEVERDGHGQIIEGRLREANRAFLRALGASSIDEIRGRTSSQIMGNTWSESLLPAVQRVMHTGLVQMQEVFRPESRRHYVTSLVRLDSDTYLGTAWDITAIRQTEQALRESEARFRVLAESVPDLVWTCTEQGDCDYLNARWIEYTGAPAETQYGFGWIKHVHREDQERVRAAWEAALKQGEPFDTEYRIRAHDGTFRWFKARGIPLRDSSGHIVKWFGATTDIEDLRRSQEQLTTVNKELESFNYAIAHDLRAPLRHINGFSNLLLQESGSGLNETARHYLSVIQGGVSRMGQLIEDLLNLSRIGRQEVRKHACRLRPLIDELIEELQPQAEGRNIEWHIADLPSVECDPSLFKQVFANLLSNALKFTKDRNPAVVEIGQASTTGESVLFVRDNGAGFDMKYAGKLFGLFQRLHRQDEFEGTGVGLAIVQRIMHRHGGRVWADAALNKGATFYISLPSAESEPIPATTPAETG